jgi:hypothetical protein
MKEKSRHHGMKKLPMGICKYSIKYFDDNDLRKAKLTSNFKLKLEQ